MEKPDWIIHFVTGYNCEICGSGEKDSDIAFDGFPFFANVHTHGLNQYGHPELCLCLALDPNTCAGILNSMGDEVRNGKVYEEGIRNDVLGDGYNVKLVKFDDEDILYVLLPDDENKFPDDEGCKEPYSYQRTYAEIIHKNNIFEEE